MDPHELERHLRDEWAHARRRGGALATRALAQAAFAGCAGCPTCRRCRNSPAAAARPPGLAADPVLGPHRRARIRAARRGAAPIRRCSRSALHSTADAGDVAAGVAAPLADAVARGKSRTRARSSRIARDVARSTRRCAKRAGGDSGELHAALARRLLRIFRRHPLSPAAAVAYLGPRGARTARTAWRRDARAVVVAGARMSLRPATARWFELLTSREELGAALDCLARTRSVAVAGLQPVRIATAAAATCSACSTNSKRSRAASGRGGPPRCRARSMPSTPCSMRRTPRSAGCAPGRSRPNRSSPNSRHSHSQRDGNRRRSSACARVAGPALPRLDRMAAAGPVLAGRVYVLPPDTPALSLPPALIQPVVDAGTRPRDVPARGRPGRRHGELDEALAARKVHRVALPADLPEDPARLRAIPRSTAHGARRSANPRRAPRWPRLDAEHGRAGGARRTGAGRLGRRRTCRSCPVTEHFAWVTGWCADT